MTYGFDVVAVGIAHEAAVVVGVVFGPHSGLVQHAGAGGDRGIKKGSDRVAIACLEGNVDLSVRLASGQRAQPERR